MDAHFTMARFILVLYLTIVQINDIVYANRSYEKLHSEGTDGLTFLNNDRRGISPWSSDEYIEMSQGRKIHICLIFNTKKHSVNKQNCFFFIKK